MARCPGASFRHASSSNFLEGKSAASRMSLPRTLISPIDASIDASMGEINVLGKDIRDAADLPSKKFEDEAWRKLAPGHRAIDVFLNQLNVYSVSPVAIFDVARVWPV